MPKVPEHGGGKLSVRAIVKRLVPVRVANRLRCWLEFRADRRRYTRYASRSERPADQRNLLQIEAQLTRDYHRVEKGLALREPKRPFGRDLMVRLDALIPVAEARTPDAPFLAAAKSARQALQDWNSGGEIDDEIAPVSAAGARMTNIGEFFATRHSVRDFSEALVDPTDLTRAVELAALSPSVCNRKPWRVRLYTGEKVGTMLAHQGGNSGFGPVPALAMVSVELAHFAGPAERNQAWIEGGIFASSLMWALHGLGLDTCMLNLSLTTVKANRLRAVSGMPPTEVPIMMMAIGYARPGHRATRSPQRNVDNLIAPS